MNIITDQIKIEEKINEIKLLNKLKKTPIFYNKYIIKKIFNEKELKILKEIINKQTIKTNVYNYE